MDERPAASTCETSGRLTRRQLVRIAGVGLLGGGAVVGLAGCAAVAARDDNRFTVSMTEANRYAPSSLTIPRRGTVVWHNIGRDPHTAIADPALARDPSHAVLPDAAEPWASGDLYPGQGWAHTFDVPGTYVYFCRFHETEGMIGTITVTE